MIEKKENDCVIYNLRIIADRGPNQEPRDQGKSTYRDPHDPAQ